VLLFTLSVVAILMAVALRLHHLFEGECLVRDLYREWKLSFSGIDEFEKRWKSIEDRSEIVVSLTTIPSRIDVIDATIKSLLDQTVLPARIILNIPVYSERESRAYTIPKRFLSLSSVHIRRCADWGPATKIIPTITDPKTPGEQPILVVDDDRIYPKDFVQNMQAAARNYPEVALTYSGWVAPKDLTDRPTTILSNLMQSAPAPIRGHRQKIPYEVDVFQGVMGYLIRPNQFDLTEIQNFSETPEAVRLVDDVRTSALIKVPKMVIPSRCLGFLPKRRYRFFKSNALANLNRGDGDPDNRNNTIALRHYRSRWMVSRDS
jgi:hypothetical protein